MANDNDMQNRLRKELFDAHAVSDIKFVPRISYIDPLHLIGQGR